MLLAALCGLGALPVAVSSATVTAEPAAALASPSLKALPHGLLDRQGAPTRRFASQFGGFVIDIAWADLQPTANGPIAPNNAIDAALALVQTDPAYGSMTIKARVRAGVLAPEWAKNLGGPPIGVVDGGATGTVGRFWTTEFGQAYDQLQRMLAAKYDASPRLGSVVMSRCTTFFAEPLLRQWGDKATQQNLIAAGYTEAQDLVCQQDQMKAHLVWQQTSSEMAFNPYQAIDAQAHVTADLPTTIWLMERCRATLLQRCVLASYSVSSPLKPSPYPEMYDAMRSLGGPTAFQTAKPELVGVPLTAVLWAASAGSSSVELPWTYKSWPAADLATMTAAF